VIQTFGEQALDWQAQWSIVR